MSLLITKKAAPDTPAANKSMVYVDTADNKIKQIDPNGVINILTQDGQRDRNIITNGGFAIQQRLTAASSAITGISTTTRAGQVADRWAVTTSVASNLNWAQIDSSGTAETGLLARYYGSIIKSSAVKKVLLSQFIINTEMAHLRGSKVRLSVKTNIKVGNAQALKLGLLQLTAAGTVDVCPAFLSGAFSASVGIDPAWGTNISAIKPDASPSAENGTISGNYLNISALQTTWLRSSCVFTVPSNAKNLIVVIFSDDSGGSTDNISIAEFQLTQGPEVIDYVEPPLAETLIRCQRFFCKSFPLTVVPAASVAVASGGNGETGMVMRAGATALASAIQIRFPVRMWKTPTLTLYTPVGAGAVPYRINGTTPAVQTAAATTGLLDMGAVVTSTGDAAGTVGDLVGLHYTAEAEFTT